MNRFIIYLILLFSILICILVGCSDNLPVKPKVEDSTDIVPKKPDISKILNK
jgi:hypothetical protein